MVMNTKIAAISAPPDFSGAKDVSDLEKLLALIPKERYPDPFYVNAIPVAAFQDVDTTVQEELGKAIKRAGFLQYRGLYIYSSDLLDNMISQLGLSVQAAPYIKAISARFVDEGFPIMAIKKMLEDTPVSYGLVEINGDMFWANQASLDALGMRLHELKGKSIISVAKDYNFRNILANQILNKEFRPYDIIWVSVEGDLVPAVVQPGAIVENMTYGTIFPVDKVFLGKFGQNVFAEKNQRLLHANREHLKFLALISDIQNKYSNNTLSPIDLMLAAVNLFQGEQSFRLDLRSSPLKLTTLDAGSSVAKELSIRSGYKGVVSYLGAQRNSYLYLSERQSYTHKLLSFLPHSTSINSCLIVPIALSKEGTLPGLLGVRKDQGQLAEGVELEVAYMWLLNFARWINIISRK
jgi:hypothetical protein